MHSSDGLFTEICTVKFVEALHNVFHKLRCCTLSEVLFDREQAHAVALELSSVICSVLGRTGEAVKLPDENKLKGMLCAVCYHALKVGAVIVPACHGSVDVLPYYCDIVGFGVVVAVV